MAVLLKLAALVLPLGLDTFAVAAALGIAGLAPRERLRVSLLFGAFEAGMPLVGFLAGFAAGAALGSVADLVAIAVLIALGVYLVWPKAESDEVGRAGLLARTRGWAVIGLGVSISLDELAIGFTIGLLKLPIILVVLLIGLQAFLATQLGLRLGSRLGDAVREGAERLAGVALAGLGVFLLLEKLLRPT
jgi:putative Mn2+ efflux pump MntP